MAVNKVVYGGETLIDLSDASVTPDTLAAGETAYNAAGEKITGTMEGAEALTVEEVWAICGYDPDGLPDGYTLLEYIQSNGTQYVDADYIPTSENLKIYAKFVMPTVQSWRSMFGSENGASGPWSLIAITNGSSKLVFYTGTSAGVGSIPVTAGQVYELTCQVVSGVLTYSCGGTNGSAAVSGTINKAQTLYVFTQHSYNASNTANQTTSMKLYACKIYDNGVLVRDFVPCKNANGAVGLYDKANKKFYANAGTGSFTAGAVVA